nr:hypothetical protein [Tanacetum cinerariifolium]
MTQGVVPRQIGRRPVPGAHHQPRHQQQHDEALHLLILEQCPAVAAQGRNVHAGPPERQRAKYSNAEVHEHDEFSHHVRTRHDLLGTVRGFGLKQAHPADAQQRQDRHGHADKADTAQPPAQNRGAGRGDARHAFEKGVGVADVLGQQERQRGEHADDDPAADGQQVHVPGPQVHMLGPALAHQRQPGDEGDQARPEERRHVGRAVENHQSDHGHDHGDGQGDEEDADNETDDAESRQRHAVARIRK